MEFDGASAALHSLLARLGPWMLDEGVTADRLRDIAGDVLLNVSAVRSRLKNGRVNASQVAAATGLTRTEVRARLNRPQVKSARRLVSIDRVSRVVMGWKGDARFATTRGHPRSLTVGGRKREFEQLVRLHSGDVPPRAVLDELLKRRLVSLRHGRIKLVATHRRDTNHHAALAAATQQLSRLLPSAPTPQFKLPFARMVEIQTASLQEETLTIGNIVEALSSTVSAISSHRRKTRRDVPPWGNIRVSFMVAAASGDPVVT